jgi:hypothetical protein
MHGLAKSLVTKTALSMLMLSQGGCSRGTEGASAAEGSKVSSSRLSSAASALGNVCDRKLVTRNDVADLLSETIKSMEPVAGDSQSCQFTSTNDSSVTVSLRPGLGDATLAEISAGQANQTVTPLAGVGRKAVWNGVLKEVNATSDNLLCDIGVVGPASGPATAEKVGALCNKIFAAS